MYIKVYLFIFHFMHYQDFEWEQLNSTKMFTLKEVTMMEVKKALRMGYLLVQVKNTLKFRFTAEDNIFCSKRLFDTLLANEELITRAIEYLKTGRPDIDEDYALQIIQGIVEDFWDVESAEDFDLTWEGLENYVLDHTFSYFKITNHEYD